MRFFQLDSQFITDRVIPELAKGEGVCKDEIKLAITYQSSDKKKRQELQEKLNPRYPNKVMLYLPQIVENFSFCFLVYRPVLSQFVWSIYRDKCSFVYESKRAI